MAPERDPAETIPAFLEVCCEVHTRFSESVRALGQTWQRWLLLQRFPTAMRRQHGERWLVDQLVAQHGFTRRRASGNRMRVKGLALREGRFAPPLPDPTRTTIALLASATPASLPESLQAHIPLRGATANKRPPSAEILRRFLAACCEVAPSGRSTGADRERGESRLALRRRLPSESLTRLGLVLRWWLVAEGVAGGIDGGLVRFCSAQWLRRELEHRGSSCWVGTEGYTLVSGLSLLPVWNKVPRLTHWDRRTNTEPVPAEGSPTQRRRLLAYTDRLDQRAKTRTPTTP